MTSSIDAERAAERGNEDLTHESSNLEFGKLLSTCSLAGEGVSPLVEMGDSPGHYPVSTDHESRWEGAS
jgi:hypothetical protein